MNHAADLADARGSGSPHLLSTPSRIKYILGRCCYCELPCEPDMYMHQACALQRSEELRKARQEAKGK